MFNIGMSEYAVQVSSFDSNAPSLTSGMPTASSTYDLGRRLQCQEFVHHSDVGLAEKQMG